MSRLLLSNSFPLLRIASDALQIHVCLWNIKSPSLGLSALVLLASAVLAAISQVFNQSVRVHKCKRYLLSPLVFAVAGCGEALHIPVWECQGASLWQDAVAGQSTETWHGLSEARPDRACAFPP